MTPEWVYLQGLCLGCGICNCIGEPGKIDFIEDEGGRFQPVCLPGHRVENLEKICPGLYLENETLLTGADQLDWGHFRRIAEGYAMDPDVRFRGASGGVLTALSAFLLEAGEIDGVLQMGESDRPLHYKLQLSRTKSDLVRNAGSKYIASDFLKNLDSVLRGSDGKFAFIGKPCDVGAVRQWLKQNDRWKDRIRIFLSFFCAGLPTFRALDRIAAHFSIRREEITGIRFRGHGWPGDMVIRTASGGEYRMDYGSSWGDYLGKDIHLRCKICPDGVGKLADIACGDAWSIRNNAPYFEEKPGVDVVFARTVQGESALMKAVRRGAIRLNPYTIRKLRVVQPYQYQRNRCVPSRMLALRLFGRSVPRYNGFGLIRIALRTGIWTQMRSFYGMLKRVPGATPSVELKCVPERSFVND